MDHVTPSLRLQATRPLLHATRPHSPLMPRLHPLIVRPVHSPPATPDRHWIDTFPFAAKSTCLSHPKNHRPRLKHRPHRIGRHQKRKTPLLYVARVVHRPCPSPLEVWTSSWFRRFTAGYSFAQVPHMLLSFLFCFRRSVLHFPNFPICIRSCFRACSLVSHPQ